MTHWNTFYKQASQSKKDHEYCKKFADSALKFRTHAMKLKAQRKTVKKMSVAEAAAKIKKWICNRMEINLNYVWAAMVINFLFVYILPKIITKPTGIKVVDDAILYLNSQKSFLLSSTIIVGIVTYLSHYWVDSQSDSVGSSSYTSPTRPGGKF